MTVLGGLFSGVGALELAVAAEFSAEHAWFAEHEPATEKAPRPRNAAARVLAHRFPGVPNLGDVADVDWATVSPVDIAKLLPTVTVTDARGGRNATAGRRDPDSAHHSGTALSDAVWLAEEWGKYGAAIARHELTSGRPAPPPTGPYGRGGEQRLCHRFVEWMMCWPDGWVTDVPGVSRNDAIKACGNGVVIPQARAAVRYLRSLAPADVLARA